MKTLPLFHKLTGAPILLVGGGGMAVAKARLLLAAGAALRVVTPEPDATLEAWAAEGKLALERRRFLRSDIEGVRLVIAASDLLLESRAASAAAQALSIPVNVVDQPALSTAIMPAIIDRDPVLVAISTEGTAPALARRLRSSIERLLPLGLGRLAAFAERFRARVRSHLPEYAQRRRFWDEFFDGPLAEEILSREAPAAELRFRTLLAERARTAPKTGSVALVGAGPGDPELLTLKALRLLQSADVVVHDRLIGPAVLDLAKRDAERIAVGKARGQHTLSQDEINALLLEQAEAGRRVVRLKGGDPFIFGRGGEEVDHLLAHGIAVEVVPGITAATGCAAVAGIPLTHRDCASAVTFVSGEGKDGEPAVDWPALARLGQTLVVYMGVARAATIAERLIAHGRAPSTPVAVVERGTLPGERRLLGRLDKLDALIAQHEVKAPALIVIGEVVAHAATGTAEFPVLGLAAE